MAFIKKEPIVEFITKGLNNPDKTKAYGYDAIEILTEIEYAPEADVVEVKQWLGHIQNDNHFPEVTKMVKAIALIEDYIEEPNSISADWLEALKLCLRLLREKVDG